MGAKQTKIEGTYLPKTPLAPLPVSRFSAVHTELNQLTPMKDEDNMDPRSPSGCRTPINVFHTQQAQPPAEELEVFQQHTPITFAENPIGMLRKRFFKGFIYNLNDPRSPSVQLNRTPLVLDEAIDKTLNLDDTFADLFVETRAPTETDAASVATTNEEQATEQLVAQQSGTEYEMHIDEMDDTHKEATTATLAEPSDGCSDTESFSLACCEEETMPCPAVLQQTPLSMQPYDPRSPTIGVERTPIIFSDDDEAGEDAMLENILATLSLDLSNASSVLSFGTSATPTDSTDGASSQQAAKFKATNKHLERVRVGKKRLPPRKFTRGQRQRIYEDCENATTSTPKLQATSGGGDSVHKRTPLSCVKNRSHLRSRSVETASVDTLKARLSLSSYDDSLNPLLTRKVANMRIMQDSQEFL